MARSHWLQQGLLAKDNSSNYIAGLPSGLSTIVDNQGVRGQCQDSNAPSLLLSPFLSVPILEIAKFARTQSFAMFYDLNVIYDAESASSLTETLATAARCTQWMRKFFRATQSQFSDLADPLPLACSPFSWIQLRSSESCCVCVDKRRCTFNREGSNFESRGFGVDG